MCEYIPKPRTKKSKSKPNKNLTPGSKKSKLDKEVAQNGPFTAGSSNNEINITTEFDEMGLSHDFGSSSTRINSFSSFINNTKSIGTDKTEILPPNDVDLILSDLTDLNELDSNDYHSMLCDVTKWDHLTLYAQTINDLESKVAWIDVFYRLVYVKAPIIPRKIFDEKYFKFPILLIHVMFSLTLIYSNNSPLHIMVQYNKLFNGWKSERKGTVLFNLLIDCHLVCYRYALGLDDQKLLKNTHEEINALIGEFQNQFADDLDKLFEPFQSSFSKKDQVDSGSGQVGNHFDGSSGLIQVENHFVQHSFENKVDFPIFAGSIELPHDFPTTIQLTHGIPKISPVESQGPITGHKRSHSILNKSIQNYFKKDHYSLPVFLKYPLKLKYAAELIARMQMYIRITDFNYSLLHTRSFLTDCDFDSNFLRYIDTTCDHTK
jgi:hypothetical protein